MKQAYPDISLAKICLLFGKSRQAWYNRVKYKQELLNNEVFILDLIKRERSVLPHLGGHKLFYRLQNEIKDQGIKIGRDNFFKILQKHNLLVKHRKRYISTTNSRHYFKTWDNLIQDIKPTMPEQIWVSDITYLKTKEGFVFLNLITDAYSRKIMGFALSQTLKAKGTIRALEMAINNRTYDHKLIHHSDRGIQYCSYSYIKILLNNNISISMTQNGSPYDNAIAERVNGILKRELNLSKTFNNYHQTIEPVVKAVHVYNRYRPHLSIDRLTPEEAHKKSGDLKKHWKKRSYSLV